MSATQQILRISLEFAAVNRGIWRGLVWRFGLVEAPWKIQADTHEKVIPEDRFAIAVQSALGWSRDDFNLQTKDPRFSFKESGFSG